jgi:hypothetical protein
MRQYSKSVITFNEFEKKLNDFHEFGNEWGLYIDIEKNASEIEIMTRRTVRINEYGMPEYIFRVEQVKNWKKDVAKKELPKIKEIKDEDQNDKNIINLNSNNNNNKGNDYFNWTLSKLFIITTSISLAVSSTFFMYFNFSNFLNFYK